MKNGRSRTQTDKLRQRAEAIFRQRSNEAKGTDALSPEEVQQIIHELRVHQIELEIQNEELRDAQVALDLSRARYFELYEMAPFGYVTISDKGIVLESNLTAADMMGMERTSLVNQPFNRYIVNEDQDVYYHHMKNLFRTGERQACELRLKRQDSSHFWARLEAIVAQEENGEIAGRMVISDITERKQMHESFRTSEEKHRRLFETMSQGVVYQDARGTIISVNPAAEKILGIPRAQIIGKNHMDPGWQTIYEDGSEMPGGQHPAMIAIRTGKPVRRTVMGVMHPVKQTYVWILNTATPICRPGETEPYQAYSILEDITEIKLLELRLVIEKEKAEAANLSKTQFLANMSHELRTPMNGFMGMVQLLQTTELTEEQDEYVRIALRSSHALLAVVNDILEYAKIESAQLKLNREPFNLEDLVNDTVKMFDVSAAHKGIRLSYRIMDGTPKMVNADMFRIRQVLTNLLGNAVKFTDDGSIEIRISKKEQLDRNRVKLLFEVEDSGIGIPHEKVGQIFERFTQIDSTDSRLKGGTGLGLSISQGLAELMGGEIRVESEMGRGSTFTFECTVEAVNMKKP